MWGIMISELIYIVRFWKLIIIMLVGLLVFMNKECGLYPAVARPFWVKAKHSTLFQQVADERKILHAFFDFCESVMTLLSFYK